jgi:hypothetical protein
VNEYQQLSWAVLAAITPTARARLLGTTMDAMWNAGGGNHRRPRARRPAPGPRLALLYRLHEIATGLWRPPPLLLATPTTATGHLDPAELVGRLQQAADGGWAPWPYDLEQALLRLPREPDPAILGRARRLPTPAGRRLAAWLTDGGLPDPEVTRAVRSHPRWLPELSQPGTDKRVGVFATITPRPGPAGPPALPTRLGIVQRLRPQRPPLAGLLCELAEPEHRGLLDLGEWLGCWPALLPSHRDVIAAHLQPRLTQLPRGGRGGGQLLPALAEADGPVGPALTLGLAYGLGARDPVDRAATVDALVLLAGRGQLDGSSLGAEIAALVGLDLLQVGRVVLPLRDVARSGAPGQVWAILATAIPGMLPPAVERPPRGLPDLVALGAEPASAIGGGQAIQALTAIAGRGGSSRLVAESRRLQRLLA